MINQAKTWPDVGDFGFVWDEGRILMARCVSRNKSWRTWDAEGEFRTQGAGCVRRTPAQLVALKMYCASNRLLRGKMTDAEFEAFFDNASRALTELGWTHGMQQGGTP